MKPVGEPDAGNLHVRFDERGRETGQLPNGSSHRARPRLYPCGAREEAAARAPLRSCAETAQDSSAFIRSWLRFLTS